MRTVEITIPAVLHDYEDGDCFTATCETHVESVTISKMYDRTIMLKQVDTEGGTQGAPHVDYINVAPAQVQALIDALSAMSASRQKQPQLEPRHAERPD